MQRKLGIFKPAEEAKPIYKTFEKIDENDNQKKAIFSVSVNMLTISKDFDQLKTDYSNSKGQINHTAVDITDHHLTLAVSHNKQHDEAADLQFRRVLGVANRYSLTTRDLSDILSRYENFLKLNGFAPPKPEKDVSQEEDQSYRFAPR